MSEVDHNVIPAPPCPVCGGPTILKNRHDNSHVDTDTCIFKCTRCGVVYPVHVPAQGGRLPRTPA
jgi:hypothetical protein